MRLKVLVGGPFAAGKTTFIKTVCGRALTTDVAVANPAERRIKRTTTVAMDYGRVTVGGIKVHLFGTPGQARFSRMIPVLARGAHALLFLVDGASRSRILAAKRMYEARYKALPVRARLVAANKQDLPGALEPRGVAEIMGLPEELVVPLVALDRESAMGVLDRVVRMAAVGVEAGEPLGPARRRGG